MATIDYSKNQATAKRMLAKYGQTMQVVTYTRDHDPVEGVNTLTVTGTATVSGVDLPASESLRQLFQSVYNEELVIKNVQYLIISADTVEFEIKTGDIIFINGEYFDIRGATVLKPANTAILYWLMIIPSTQAIQAFDNLVYTTMEELNDAILELIETSGG